MNEEQLHGVAVYNPGLWSRQELKRYFVARNDLLERIVSDLRREQPGSMPQNRLLLGLRGMGKTMLLRRLAIAIEEDDMLGSLWLPLTFPEEQYNIDNLTSLWFNCLDALGDNLEQKGLHREAGTLDKSIASLPRNNAEAALNLLLEEAAKRKRRLVLLIDNVDLVLDRLKSEHWTFRDILQSTPSLLIIGASARGIESSYQYDAAFYDFFKINELKGLSESEMRATLERLADVGGTPKVIEIMHKDPGRIKALHALTGGNPRTTVLLYNILAQGLDGDVRSDLESLLDRVSPLYKARFEELSVQAQKVIDAMAINWDPVSANQLAERLGWEVNTVSAQISRLEHQAVVEKVAPASGKRAAFQIGERFFNIWYLMRASRRVRRRLIWLVHFLRMFFSVGELQSHARQYLSKQQENPENAEYNLALAQTLDASPLSYALENHAIQILLGNKDTRRKIQQLFNLDDQDAKLRPRVVRMQQLSVARDKLKQLTAEFPIITETFIQRLLGSISLTFENKLSIVEKLAEVTTEQLTVLDGMLATENKKFERIYGSHTALLCQVISSGEMSGIDDTEGTEAASERWHNPVLAAIGWQAKIETFNELTVKVARHIEQVFKRALKTDPRLASIWYSLGTLLNYHFKHYGEAEEAYREAIKIDSNSASSWNGLGNLLSDHFKLYVEAEEAYRKAIKINSQFAHPWNGLGKLLSDHFKHYDEAEKAYYKAIEIDPQFVYPWYNLGNLLSAHFKRYGEAEAAYRKALEINPHYAYAWNSMGNLLSDHSKRYDEAGAAYRKAIEIDSQFAHPWNGLGNLLTFHSKLFEEAEKSFRKAIEIDSHYAYPWNGLGNLLYFRFKRYDEAEEAYRKAIKINSHYASPWNGLGRLLSDHFKRYDEAEEAYRKAIMIDPQRAYPWNNLGNLLSDHFKRYDEAETVYRKAIEIDPSDGMLHINLARFLYKQQRSYKEAISLAEKATALAPPNLYYVLTLATLHVHQGNWFTALPYVRRLLYEGNEDFFVSTWNDMLLLFHEIVKTEKTQQALEILDATDAGERWRPLKEALVAIATGNPKYLNGVAPEVREPALAIVKIMTSD